MQKSGFIFAILLIFGLPVLSTPGQAQSNGTIRGSVVVQARNMGLHGATVLVAQLGRSVETGEDGSFELLQIAPGQYDLVASSPGMSSEVLSVTVEAGGIAVADFRMGLSPIRQQITVTATGVEQTAFESFQTVNTLDSFDLAAKGATAIGEVLDSQPGVSKRTSGPGTARPVIRGFDGDRVLVLQDGVRTGTLSSQSADHGEPIDVLNLERLEVVKGPATLMYGSNAIGGVVNAVSGHHQMKEASPDGLRGSLTVAGGSGNRYGAGGIGFEYGRQRWLFWGSGSQQKTGAYRTPLGVVPNSGTRLSNGTAGLGWFGPNSFSSFSFGYDDGIYGIPFFPGDDLDEDEGDEHEEGEDEHGHSSIPTKLDFLRRNARFSTAFRNLGPVIDGIRVDLNYSGWYHKELEFLDEGPEVGTLFNNKQYTYQAFFDQKRRGGLTGTLGFYGLYRDYIAAGEEAISPPVKLHVTAVFALEEMDFEHFKLQFGARLENTRYSPAGLERRSFTGVSGAFGIHIPVWTGGAFVTNYTHSYRAPALEELFNDGPHLGNQTFEIGNPLLERERSDGIDISLRHIGNRFRSEFNYYFYDLGNFVYLSPTGREVEELIEAVYAQGNTRYTGFETSLDIQAHEYLWLNGGLDYVNAELRASNTPIPRIPPLRGRLGLDIRHAGFSLRPEVVMAKDQNRIFPTETRTAGYTIANLSASYTLPMQHFSHNFTLNAFNLGDRLYRNHLSFIKDLAPEIGRGVKLTYSVKFF